MRLKWSLGQSRLREAWPANLGPRARMAFRVQQDRAGSRPAPFPRGCTGPFLCTISSPCCSTNPSPTFQDLLKTHLAGHSGYREKGFSLKGDMRGTWTRKPTKQPSVLATDRDVYRACEGPACWGGCRHSTQNKWIIHCVTFSVAGAQGTYGGGRTARART